MRLTGREHTFVKVVPQKPYKWKAPHVVYVHEDNLLVCVPWCMGCWLSHTLTCGVYGTPYSMANILIRVSKMYREGLPVRHTSINTLHRTKVIIDVTPLQPENDTLGRAWGGAEVGSLLMTFVGGLFSFSRLSVEVQKAIQHSSLCSIHLKPQPVALLMNAYRFAPHRLTDVLFFPWLIAPQFHSEKSGLHW